MCARFRITVALLAIMGLLCSHTMGTADFLEEALAGAWQSSYGTTLVMDEQWHHLAATHDGEFLRAYTDGVMEGEAAAPNPPDNNADPVRIGRWGNPRGDFMNGLIDEVAIFNRALTEEEINSVMTGLARMLAVEPSGKLATTWGYIRN